MALPRLVPGKSVRFALLPEGQDPDDLYRSGGREAIAEVLGSARGLADMLWTRETEAAAFDTPERRAALEARLKEIITRHRRRDGAPLLRRGLRRAAAAAHGAEVRRATEPRGAHAATAASAAARRQSGGRGWQNSDGAQPRPGPGAFAAAQRQAVIGSPIVRGHRSAVPPREALILITVVNHPWLLENHAEEFAELEFLNPDADLLRRAILEAGIDHQADETAASDKLRAALDARGLGPAAGPRRGRDHPHVGLAGQGRDGDRRRGPVVDPRRYLASQEAHAK